MIEVGQSFICGHAATKWKLRNRHPPFECLESNGDDFFLMDEVHQGQNSTNVIIDRHFSIKKNSTRRENCDNETWRISVLLMWNWHRHLKLYSSLEGKKTFFISGFCWEDSTSSLCLKDCLLCSGNVSLALRLFVWTGTTSFFRTTVVRTSLRLSNVLTNLLQAPHDIKWPFNPHPPLHHPTVEFSHGKYGNLLFTILTHVSWGHTSFLLLKVVVVVVYFILNLMH